MTTYPLAPFLRKGVTVDRFAPKSETVPPWGGPAEGL